MGRPPSPQPPPPAGSSWPLTPLVERFRVATSQTGLSPDEPRPDPCLPPGLEVALATDNRTVHLRGQGDWDRCLRAVRPLLGLHNGTMSLGGVYQVGGVQSGAAF